MDKTRSAQRLLLLQLTTVLISFCFSLLLGEIILRSLAWYNSHYGIEKIQKQQKAYEFSPSRHHRLKPNFRYRHKEVEYDYLWENNGLGMRDRERSITKDPQTFRILFLGDSMVQGYGVPLEQSMVYLLEKNLNENSNKKIEVLNAGVFGYSPFLEFLYLQELITAIKPDLVIEGFFLGNDVGDDYFYTQQAKFLSEDSVKFTTLNWPWDYRNKVLEKKFKKPTDSTSSSKNEISPATPSSKIRSFLRSVLYKSHLVRSIVTFKKSLQQREKEKIALERQNDIAKEYQDDIRVNLGMVAYPTSSRQERLKYWHISLSYLKKMHQLCEQKHIPMVLVVIPKLDPATANFTEPYDLLNELGKNEQFPVIHLLPEMRQIPLEKLFYKLDGHWNREGNQLVEKIIRQKLLQTNLLPSSVQKTP